MKVLKDGSLKLSQIDLRVGNFVFSNFADAIGFSDIARRVQTRVSKETFIGQMLTQAVLEKRKTFLRNYGTMLFYIVGLAPDDQFIKEAFAAAESCIKRHPDLYGTPPAQSEEKDQKIIQEEKELHEFAEEIKKAAKE